MKSNANALLGGFFGFVVAYWIIVLTIVGTTGYVVIHFVLKHW